MQSCTVVIVRLCAQAGGQGGGTGQQNAGHKYMREPCSLFPSGSGDGELLIVTTMFP